MTSTSPMLDPAEFAYLSKTVLKLSETPLPGDSLPESAAAPLRFPHPETSLAPESKTKNQGQTTAVLAAMTRLVEIVAELRSHQGGWPTDLPKTSENLIPYVHEEACDVLDALKESGSRGAGERGSRGDEEQRSRGDEEKNISPAPSHPCPPADGGHPAPLIVVDDLIPRLLWHLVSSSYDVMQLIGGVPARVVRSRSGVATLSPKANPDAAKSEMGLIRLVVSLSVWNSDHYWAIDLATHNVTEKRAERKENREFSEAFSILYPLSSVLYPLSAGELLVKLRQEIEFTSPELAKLMEPRSVEWLPPNHQWLTGFLQLKMDWEFLPKSPENCPETEHETEHETEDFDEAAPLDQPIVADISAISESEKQSGAEANSLLRLAQPAVFQESAKIPFKETLISILPQIQPESISETGLETGLLEKNQFLTAENESLNSNLISEVVKTAYDLVENWEFPWGDGEVLLDECMQRLLWQTITSSYPVMQLIGSVEAMVLSPGQNWKIGIIRLLAIFEIQVGNETITVDLSTGQCWEKSQDNKVLPLSPNTIVRFRDSGSLCESPNTQLSMQLSIQPVMAEDFLNTLSQQIQANTPSFQWLMNGVEIDLMNAAGIWESGLGKLRLELEFIPA